LVKEALKELKSSARTSTNESDSSDCLSPLLKQRMSFSEPKGLRESYYESLQKGYVMVKHSPNSKPKEKYIYVSGDRRYLCWKSLDKDDEKRVELRKVNSILRGSQGTLGFIQSRSVKELERLIIVRWESRDLELEAFNIEESVKFAL
jgi:hypothetical protein